VYQFKQVIKVDVENPDNFMYFFKEMRVNQIKFRDGVGEGKALPPITEDPYDTSILFPPRCDDILCTKSVMVPKAEATKKLALFLGSEVVNPDITPSEFDAILDAIPEETLLEALKKLAVDYHRKPEFMESEINRMGGDIRD
jgi:hypothetical protein